MHAKTRAMHALAAVQTFRLLEHSFPTVGVGRAMVPHMLLDTSRCEEATAVLASSILRRHLPLHFLNAAFLLLVFAAVEVVAATSTRQASAADIHLRPPAPLQARRAVG